MECKKIENKLLFYLEGEIQAMERKAIESHLLHCASCRLKYEFLKSSMQVIDKEKELEVRPFLYTRIQSKIDAPVISRRQWVLAPVLMTVIVVLGLFIGTVIGKKTVSPKFGNDTTYEVAYLFNDTQLESLEYKLLNDE